MTQTSDILEAIRSAGIPLNTTQLAEQLPHIPKPSISAACSQLRQQGVLTGTVEDGRLHFQVVAGAGPSDTYKTHVDDEAPDTGDEHADAPESPTPIDVTPVPEKPPTQSFSPAGMDIRTAIDEIGDPSTFSKAVAELRHRAAEASPRSAIGDEAAKNDAPANPELKAAAVSAERIHGALRARPARNDVRLCRELAAAVLAHWPGQIPYDVQRLVNSAATLPL